jgi:hypothetical protein
MEIFGWRTNLENHKQKLFFRNGTRIKVQKLNRTQWKFIVFKNGKVVESDIGNESYVKILVGECAWREF